MLQLSNKAAVSDSGTAAFVLESIFSKADLYVLTHLLPIQTLHCDQRQAQVTNLDQHAVQGSLVINQSQEHCRPIRLVADCETVKPLRPSCRKVALNDEPIFVCHGAVPRLLCRIMVTLVVSFCEFVAYLLTNTSMARSCRPRMYLKW